MSADTDKNNVQAQEGVYHGAVLPELQDLIEAGVFYGRKKSKTDPRMKPYVLLNRGNIEIFNLQKTQEAMDAVAAFLKEKVRQGGLVLLVATQPAAEGVLLRVAKKFGLPYVATRWAGGIITNFKIISGRIEYFKKLRSDLASGVLEKYTKKERLMFERELDRLRELFEGLEKLVREPDVLVVVDPGMHHTAVREARRKKIPVVALANVDADPTSVDHLVPGNDNAKRSIEWFFGNIEKAIEEGLAMRSRPADSASVAASAKGATSGEARAAAPKEEV